MGKFDTSIVGNMFNDQSKTKTQNPFKIVYIDINDIVPNERNKEVSMGEIDDLKENIKLVGLEQNLVVAPPKNGKYTLITGHRRLKALISLVKEGETRFKKVPCIINNPADFKYSLSEEKQETLAWVSTNIMSRKPTTQDLLVFTKALNDVYDELRKNNPGIVLGTKKEYISENLNISESQVQVLNSINSHLTQKPLKAFLNNEISLVAARDLAKMPEIMQLEFVKEHEDLSDITSGDILLFKKEYKQKQLQPSKPSTATFGLAGFGYIAELCSTAENLLDDKSVEGDVADKVQKLADNIERDMKKLVKLLQD